MSRGQLEVLRSRVSDWPVETNGSVPVRLDLLGDQHRTVPSASRAEILGLIDARIARERLSALPREQFVYGFQTRVANRLIDGLGRARQALPQSEAVYRSDRQVRDLGARAEVVRRGLLALRRETVEVGRAVVALRRAENAPDRVDPSGVRTDATADPTTAGEITGRRSAAERLEERLRAAETRYRDLVAEAAEHHTILARFANDEAALTTLANGTLPEGLAAARGLVLATIGNVRASIDDLIARVRADPESVWNMPGAVDSVRYELDYPVGSVAEQWVSQAREDHERQDQQRERALAVVPLVMAIGCLLPLGGAAALAMVAATAAVGGALELRHAWQAIDDYQRETAEANSDVDPRRAIRSEAPSVASVLPEVAGAMVYAIMNAAEIAQAVGALRVLAASRGARNAASASQEAATAARVAENSRTSSGTPRAGSDGPNRAERRQRVRDAAEARRRGDADRRAAERARSRENRQPRPERPATPASGDLPITVEEIASMRETSVAQLPMYENMTVAQVEQDLLARGYTRGISPDERNIFTRAEPVSADSPRRVSYVRVDAPHPPRPGVQEIYDSNRFPHVHKEVRYPDNRARYLLDDQGVACARGNIGPGSTWPEYEDPVATHIILRRE